MSGRRHRLDGKTAGERPNNGIRAARREAQAERLANGKLVIRVATLPQPAPKAPKQEVTLVVRITHVGWDQEDESVLRYGFAKVVSNGHPKEKEVVYFSGRTVIESGIDPSLLRKYDLIKVAAVENDHPDAEWRAVEFYRWNPSAPPHIEGSRILGTYNTVEKRDEEDKVVGYAHVIFFTDDETGNETFAGVTPNTAERAMLEPGDEVVAWVRPNQNPDSPFPIFTQWVRPVRGVDVGMLELIELNGNAEEVAEPDTSAEEPVAAVVAAK